MQAKFWSLLKFHFWEYEGINVFLFTYVFFSSSRYMEGMWSTLPIAFDCVCWRKNSTLSLHHVLFLGMGGGDQPASPIFDLCVWGGGGVDPSTFYKGFYYVGLRVFLGVKGVRTIHQPLPRISYFVKTQVIHVDSFLEWAPSNKITHGRLNEC